jgi:hypothetical protein
MVVQGSFDEAGHIDPKPKLDALAKTGAGAAKGAAGAFGAFEPPPPPRPATEGRLTAEWIDYEIRAPGRPPLRVRRQLFDLLGPAARGAGPSQPVAVSDAQAVDRSLSTLGETEILLQPCLLSPSFIAHVAAQGVLANRELIRAAVASEGGRSQLANELIERFIPPPGPVYGLAFARGQWSPVRGEVFLDRPNVLSYHRQLRRDAAGRLVLCEGFDIVANQVAVRGQGVGQEATARSIRLRQGVADTAAEAVLASGCGRLENTSELFAAAGVRGEPWATISPGDHRDLAAFNLPADVRAQVERDLAAGYVVVVPRKAVELDGRKLVAWWRVDPVSGDTLGIGQNGWGSTASERALLHARIMLKAFLTFKCIGNAVGGGQVAMCIAIGALGGVGLRLGGMGGGVVAYAADILSAMK